MSAPRTQTAPAEYQPFTGPNRRRHPRELHLVAATIQPASGNADVDEAVVVGNLSLGGVGLICSHAYRLDTVWRITLGNGPLFLNAKIRVVNCRVRQDGKFDVGCTFC
jgi:hypothetical protein